MNGMLFTLPPRQQRNTVGWFAHPCRVTFTTDVFGNDLYLHFSHNVFFSYRPKGGLTSNDSTNFQAFKKCSYWKSAPAPMQCARPCQWFHYFQFFAALPSGLPCTVQFFERSEAAIFRCVHWFNPSERKLLLVGRWVGKCLRKEKNWANVWLIGKSRWKSIDYFMKYQYRAVLSFVPPPLALTFIWNNSENNGNVLEFSFTLKFSCIFHGMWPRQSSKFNTPTNEFNLDTNADLKNYSMSQSGQKCSTDAIIMCRTVGVPISVHLSLRFQSFNASSKAYHFQNQRNFTL